METPFGPAAATSPTDAQLASLICTGCGKKPEELGYKFYAEPNQTAAQYVWQEEGTLNRRNGHFLCDGCYIKAGMPSSPRGWVAP